MSGFLGGQVPTLLFQDNADRQMSGNVETTLGTYPVVQPQIGSTIIIHGVGLCSSTVNTCYLFFGSTKLTVVSVAKATGIYVFDVEIFVISAVSQRIIVIGSLAAADAVAGNARHYYTTTEPIVTPFTIKTSAVASGGQTITQQMINARMII